MSKSLTVSFVDTMSLDQNDDSSTDTFYDDVIKDLSQTDLFTNVRLISITGGTTTYTIPDDVVKILEMFYDSSVIPQSTINSLNALDQEWRDLVGRPVAHIVEEETTKLFRLYPEPDVDSKDFSFLLGEPLGRDFPEYSVGIVNTEIRDNNPDWLDYIIGLKVIAKEHQKNSDIVDPQFASLCDQLADLLAGALNA